MLQLQGERGEGGEEESGCVGKVKKKKHFRNPTVVMLYLSHLKGGESIKA